MGIIGAYMVGAAIALKFRRRIEETLAVGVILITLLIYLPGRVFSLIPGFICAGILIFASLIYCIYGFVRSRDDLKAALITWGSLAFVIYAVFFAWYAFHRDFSHPDELYSLGLYAKNLYYLGSMNAKAATNMSLDQTPFLPLWNVFCARTWTGFSPSVCYFGQNMFTVSLMLPAFASADRRKPLDVPRFLILIALIPALLMLSGLESFRYILVDEVLAAGLCFFVMSVISFITTSDRYFYIASLAGVICLCLTKRMGVLFASLAIFVVSDALFGRVKEAYRYILGFLAAAVIVSVTWFGLSYRDVVPVAVGVGIFVFRRLCDSVMKMRRPLRDILCAICIPALLAFPLMGLAVYFRGDGYAYGVLARFMDDLISVTPEEGHLILSYGIYMFLLIIAGVWSYRNRETGDPGMYLICRNLFTAMYVYAIAMLYMHIAEIGRINEYRESIIPRYMIPWEILAVLVIIYILVNEDRRVTLPVMCIILLAVFIVSDTGEFGRGIFSKHRCAEYNAFADAGVELKKRDMVYFIDEENEFDYSDREFYYCAFPARTNFIDDIFLGNNGRLKIDSDKLKSYLVSDMYLNKPYDYLYLRSYEDDFADRFGELFEDPGDIAPDTVYAVVHEGEDVTLRRIEK